MAGDMLGLDIEAVREMANVLRQQAEEVRSTVQEITQQLGETDWMGPDADRFEDEWVNTHASKLNEIAAALDDFAGSADANAAEQEGTSSSY
ncbi:WXG100 family type VII secretion target [Myceligenerans halotolerans]